MQRLKRSWAVMLNAAFFTVVLVSLPLHAADGEYTIRANTSEVRIAFAASDRDGHPITSLQATDVAVADNGWIIREFRSFRPVPDGQLNMVILLDSSDSVASQLAGEIASVQELIESSQWSEHDRVTILSFGGKEPKIICARNCGEAAAATKLNNLRSNGLTPLYDALVKGAEILKQESTPETRPAMIVISDGNDTISINSVPDVVDAAQNLQAAIYCINSRGKKAYDHGDHILDVLAAETGGISFAPGEETGSALQSIMHDLRSGYVLTYALPQQTGEHSVRLLPTANPKLRFRSRSAYNDGSMQ